MNLLHRLVCRSTPWRWTVERWVIPWALDGLDPGEDVLELGPGPGLTTDVLRERAARLTAVEIDPRLASLLQERMKNTNVEVAEAAERQKLLAEAVADGETPPASLKEMTRQHRVVFVLHREDLTKTLEAFAGEKHRLVSVVPGKGDYGGGKGIEGIRGSWLVFETPEQEEHPDQR